MENTLIAEAPSDSPIVLTPSHFFQYVTHPQWIWFDRFGNTEKKEEISEFTLKLMENGVLHEKSYISEFDFTEVELEKSDEAAETTLRLMQQGVPLIYQGCIQIECNGAIYRGRPDLLEKREGFSTFGNWHYVPIEIKSSSDIKILHKHQLTFYALILEKIQGLLPSEMAIINRHRTKIPFTLNSKHQLTTIKLIEEIIGVMRGHKPTSTITSKSKNSPWFKKALGEAQASRDISLIYRLDSRSLSSLRKMGIKTLEDMVAADIAELPKVSYASPETLQKAQLQAQSLIDNKVLRIGDLDHLPETPLKLYFDIEGNPLLDVDYLFGIWVSGDPTHQYAPRENVRFYKDEDRYFLYFLANRPEDEKAMWDAFVNWVKLLPEEYTVFHYANYEKTHLEKLSELYGDSPHLHRFQDNLVDLQQVIEKSIIFPLHFYSIKDIAKSPFLNFKWRHQKAGGGQSVFWFDQWLATNEKSIMDDIINYNEDDVRATEALFLWLKNPNRLRG